MSSRVEVRKITLSLGSGWPAAGAFTSPRGPGEGLFGKGSERNVKQFSDAQFRS